MGRIKEVGKDVGETLENEAEGIVKATKKVGRWARKNPIKTVLGIVAAIFLLR